MKFGEVSLDEAEGSFLAHSLGQGSERLKKGTLLGAEEIARLKASGFTNAIVARLEEGDVGEDTAAERLAVHCQHASLRLGDAATGRVNIHAVHDGLFVVNKDAIDAINRVDPAITIATLARFAPVTRGQMVATVKIIPFAVSDAKLSQIEKLFAALGDPLFEVAAWQPRRVGLVTTLLPSLKSEVIDKTNRVLQTRLSISGSNIVDEKRVAHTSQAVGAAIAELAKDNVDLIIVFGASAVVDPYDVIPEGIRVSGGDVIQVGMPVDPGNLLVLGEYGSIPIIGAPGCARSPKENGFDWILDRVIAGVPVTPDDFATMGVGGLLMEIETRPRPRDPVAAKRKPMLAGLLLAAGKSSRTGAYHKLRAEFDGIPLLRRSADVLAKALGSSPLVVLGHDAERMSALLSAHAKPVFNPDYAEGLSTSLRAGVAALPQECDGVLVHLADMPSVTASHIALMADAFVKSGGNAIIRATSNGKRGNPVVLPRSVFTQVSRLTGDMGARAIIESFSGQIIDVELGDAASLDVDTPEALKAAGGVAVAPRD
ncbi:MAG: NTP transferase domain-containing protein [Rhizobiaceae bacterium]